MKKTVSKFQIQDMLPIGLTIVVLGIGLSYGLNVMSDVQGDMVTGATGCNATDTTNCGLDYTATQSAMEGVSKLPEKLPLIVTVIVAAIIIGILVRYLMVKYN